MDAEIITRHAGPGARKGKARDTREAAATTPVKTNDGDRDKVHYDGDDRLRATAGPEPVMAPPYDAIPRWLLFALLPHAKS